MILSLHQIRNEFPEINERDHTERDFMALFKRRRVYYSEQPLDESILGYYETDYRGREHIVINSTLKGVEKLRTQAHEGNHLVLDHPLDGELIKMFRSMEVLQTRQDITAEALSLVLIFSYKTLEKFILTGDIPEHLRPYIEERLMILEVYGI